MPRPQSSRSNVKGLSGTQSSLVGEIFRLLHRRRIQWVLLENVPFMMQLAKGHALERVLSEFENLGYKWAYRVINSKARTSHCRKRVFILASRNHDPRDVLLSRDAAPKPEPDDHAGRACGLTDRRTRGLGWRLISSDPEGRFGMGHTIPTGSAHAGGVVMPNLKDTERLQGFRSNWTKPAEDVARASTLETGR